jgi:hypothetical protein
VNPSRRAVTLASVVAVTVAVTQISGCTARRPDGVTPSPSALAPSLSSGLAERTARAAESDPHFLRKITLHSARIGCIADPFGTRPENISTADQAQVVYANLYCAGVTDSGSLDGAEAAILPAAVTLGSPPSIVTPGDGGDWTASVHRVIPRQWWQRAGDLADPDGAREKLARRLATLAMAKPSASPS